jgi:hypothetical protein
MGLEYSINSTSNSGFIIHIYHIYKEQEIEVN